MEAFFEAHDDSTGANPSSVKSEDGSPPPDEGCGSPPPNCAICLGRCRNKSFTDSCLHQFCFKCLVTWSKVKTECPLCKQNFRSIIHNVQANQQYEEYRVEQRRQEGDFEREHIEDLVTATRRFRYRTTLTFPRGNVPEHLTLQRLLLHYPISAMVGLQSRSPQGIAPAPLPASRRRRSPSSFRPTVYRHNLWARPLPDFTGRHRDCTPEFYRNNGSQLHRLMPWLNRELHYLLLENTGHIAYVLDRILELLPQYHITSPEFRCDMYRYFGSRTDHFLHELHCFASTPYDLTGYDRNVQYTTDSQISNNVNNIISSSDTESGDSDIVLVYPNSPTPPYRPPRSASEPQPGPSLPGYNPLSLVTAPTDTTRTGRNVIPIETISQSDTDDDEVMVTGYIKPPHQRTPEVVDLRDSDSDVVVSEETIPARAPLPMPLVKLTLSRPRTNVPAPTDSEADDATYTPPLRPDLAHSSEDSVPDGHTSLVVWPTTERTKRRRTRRSRDADRARTTGPDDSSAERDRHRDARKRKSCNGKGVKSSRRDTESRRADEPGPSARPAEKRLRSHRDDADPAFALAEVHESRPEPYFRPGQAPGQSFRPDKRSRSRRDDTDSSRPALAEVHESRPEPFFRPGQTSEQTSRPDKRSRSRRDETDSSGALVDVQESRSSRSDEKRDIPLVTEPGLSSRPDKKSALSRDDTDPSRASVLFQESQPGPSRYDEKRVRREEPHPGPSSTSRHTDKKAKSRKNESRNSTESRRVDVSSQVTNEPISGSSREESQSGPSSTSRHTEKKVKSRKNESRNSTESRRVEVSTQVKDEPTPESARTDKPAQSPRKEKRQDTATEKRSVTTSVREDSIVIASTSNQGQRDVSTETRLNERELMETRAGSSRTDISSLKRKHEDVPGGRDSRENKRLKSVVTIASGSSSSSSSASAGHAASSARSPTSTVREVTSARGPTSAVRKVTSARGPTSAVSEVTSAARPSVSRDSSSSRSSTSSSSSSSKPLSKYNPFYWSAENSPKSRCPDSATDSEDDIPLNLTIQRLIERFS